MLLPQDIPHRGRGVSGLLLLPQVVSREQPLPGLISLRPTHQGRGVGTKNAFPSPWVVLWFRFGLGADVTPGWLSSGVGSCSLVKVLPRMKLN